MWWLRRKRCRNRRFTSVAPADVSSSHFICPTGSVSKRDCCESRPERLSVADLVKSGEIEKPDLEHLRRIREQYDPDPYRLMRSCHLKRVVAKLRRAGRQATAASCPLQLKLSSKCRRNYVASRLEEYQRQLRKINVQAQERKMAETQATLQEHRIVEESPATANEMKRNRPRPVRKGPER